MSDEVSPVATSPQQETSDDFFDHHHTPETYTQLETITHVLDQPDPYKTGIIIPEADDFFAYQLMINDKTNIYSLALNDRHIMSSLIDPSFGNCFDFSALLSEGGLPRDILQYHDAGFPESCPQDIRRTCFLLNGLRLHINERGTIPAVVSATIIGYRKKTASETSQEEWERVVKNVEIYPYGTYPLFMGGPTKSIKILSYIPLTGGYMIHPCFKALIKSGGRLFFNAEQRKISSSHHEFMSLKQISSSVDFSQLSTPYIVIPDVPIRQRESPPDSKYSLRVMQSKYITYDRKNDMPIF